MSAPSPARRLLLPLAPLYRLGLAWREWRLRSGREPVRRLGWPVVSVGNLSTGGAGKTPLVIALAKALAARGMAVDVLSRGYGRTGSGATRVDPEGSAALFGDEPLVIAREAGVPVYVAAERYEAGLLAESDARTTGWHGRRPISQEAHQDSKFAAYMDLERSSTGCQDSGFVTGYDFSRAEKSPVEAGALAPEGIHLLDDGFQHRQLHRDVDILLLSARDLDDHLLPAGNLREPLGAIHRASVIAIPCDEPRLEAALQAHGWTGPIWRLRRQMEVSPVAGPVVAFCGIARPEQFFAGLQAAGLHVASRVAFRDHHRYVEHDIDCLRDAARSVKVAAFITTEKDRARLGEMGQKLAAAAPLLAARLHIEIEDESASIDWLVAQIQSAVSAG